MAARLNGTQGYAEAAETLLAGYEGVPFDQLHADILKLLPPAPARVLLRAEKQDGYFKRPGVSWTRLTFAKEGSPASR